MQATLRDHFGSTSETYSPSEGSCDLFVSGNQLYLSWKKIRAVAKQHRWTYEVVIEGGRTRVRFMMGSPLWDYTNNPTSVVANTTIKHALDNGLFCPKAVSTRAERIGTTETVHIAAVPRRATRVSVGLAEALLDRTGVLDIHLRRGSVSVVCIAGEHQSSAINWDVLQTAAKTTQARIQRTLRKICRNNRRTAAAVKVDSRRERRGAGKIGVRLPSVPRRTMSCAFPGESGPGASGVAPVSAGGDSRTDV